MMQAIMIGERTVQTQGASSGQHPTVNITMTEGEARLFLAYLTHSRPNWALERDVEGVIRPANIAANNVLDALRLLLGIQIGRRG